MTHQKTRKSGALSALLTLALVLVLLPLAATSARAEVRIVNSKEGGLGTTSIYWSGDVHAENCAGWPAPEYSLYSNYTGQVLKVYLEDDTNLIIPEGKTLTAQTCAIEAGDYTLTVMGGGTFRAYGSQLYGNIVISGSALDWKGEMEVYSLTVENGGVVDTRSGDWPLAIIGGGLTVNDGSVTASTDYGIILEDCDMTVNEGGRVTVVKGGIAGESWNGKAPSVILNGGVLKSDDYRNVPVTVAPGWTYAADGEGSYTGTLSAEQLAAAAGKRLASPLAQIGETKYSFLQDAFDAAGPDDAVRLLRDVKQPIGETLNVNGSLTLDLNGHTITERLKHAGAIFTLASGAALTLSGDGRIVDTTSGDVTPHTFVVRGAGAAESSVVIAGGAVVFGGTVTDGWYDGNITFLNCGVTVNGGSLFARARSTVIDSGSLTVNDGAVVDLGFGHTSGECVALTDVTVNSGSLLLRGEDGFRGGTGDKKVNTMTINGGTVELRESDMSENPNGNGIFITGGIKLNGGALRMGMLAGEGDTIAFSDAYTYAVEDMPGTYCGVTLTKSEAAALGNRWIAPLVASVTLNKTATTLTVGGTETLTATVVPSGALDRRVGWSSSNEGVATVDANGKVTAVKAGTATITVTTTDGGKTATCSVTVKAATPSVTGSLSGTTLSYTVKNAPSNAKLIAAWYDGSGKMLGMASASPTKGNSTGTLTVGSGAARYKLMLVDGSTYAPLCEPMIADYT